jgi:4-diphosphocytidyl-2-C-methyl-D-erythritol kinase
MPARSSAKVRTWTADAARVNAPAKINLRLQIVDRRDDGHHLLDSIVVPIDLHDDVDIRIERAPSPGASVLCEPPAAAPAGTGNLAVRAALWFMDRTRSCAHVTIRLTKRIPAGAGLGGGSSDAAAVLRALNALIRDPVKMPDLMASSLTLGADVPLFIFGRPAHMTGVGEILEACPTTIRAPAVVAFAGASLSTAAVYAKYDDLLTMSAPLGTIHASVREPLRTMLQNDLEAAAFQIQPGLHSLKRRLCSLGAEGASMTGSGSAMFGIWRHWDDAWAAAEQLRMAGVWARVVRVLDRVPAVELV